MKTFAAFSVALVLPALLPAQPATAPADVRTKEAAVSPSGPAVSEVAAGALAPLELAPPDIGQRTLDRLHDRVVETEQGEPLGKVRDVAIDAGTGKLAFLVLSRADSAPTDDALRLLSVAAVEPARGLRVRSALVTVGAAPRWADLPAVERGAFEAGRVEAKMAPGSDEGERRYVRGSSLRGKLVRSGDYDVGRIEELAIDLGERRALALMVPSAQFAAGRLVYLLPLARLTSASLTSAPLLAALTRLDFEQAIRPRRAAEEALSPTGRSSTEQSQDLSEMLTPKTTAPRAPASSADDGIDPRDPVPPPAGKR